MLNRDASRRRPELFSRHLGIVGLLVSKFISTTGECVFLITLYWLVMNRGGGSADIAWLMVATTTPALFTVLQGGALIDRLDRRLVAQAMETVRGLAVGAIGLSAMSGASATWQLYLAVAVIGTATYTLWSCQSAMLPAVAGTGRIDRGNTLWQTAVQGGAILGPVTGGFVVGRYGTGAGIWVTAACYLGSTLVLGVVGRAPHDAAARRVDQGSTGQGPADPRTADQVHGVASGTAREALREALRELRSSPPVRYATLFAVIPTSFVAIGNVVLIPFARQLLHASALSASTMDTLWGLGALAGSAGTAYLNRAARRKPLPACVLLIAVGSAAIAASPDTGAADAAVVLAGLAVGWANVVFPSHIQKTARPAFLGRIFSAVQFATVVVTLVSSALLGVVGNLASPRAVFLATSIALVGAGVLIHRLLHPRTSSPPARPDDIQLASSQRSLIP